MDRCSHASPIRKALTGGTYKVFFSTSGGNPVWGVFRHPEWEDRHAGEEPDRSDGEPSGALIVDGIEIRVTGAPNDFKDFGVVADASGPVSPEQAATINSDAYGYPHTLNNGTPDGTKQQSAGLTASQGWVLGTGMNSPSMSPYYDQFVARVTNSGARWPLIIPNDYEIRFAPGKALIVADFGASAG